ncbi:MAG: tetratricopeptide repeat protein [Burkholderia sp.]|nr:MAG: Beta-barrel assembly-enhancing protease [Burkholderia gladioli]
MIFSSTLSSKRPAACARRAFAFLQVRRVLFGTALLAAWTLGTMPVHAQTPVSGAVDDDALTQNAFSPAYPDEKKDLPDVPLTAQIVYQVLAAEVALQRAQPAPAFQTYLALAGETKDPRMAQRATEIALAAQSPTDALTAANLWREYAPDSNRAGQVAAALLVLTGKPLDAELLLGRELAHTDADSRRVAILAMQALISRGPNRVDGLTVLQHLLKDDLIRPESHLAIARQQLAVDDQRAVVTSLKQALELKPDYLPAALMLSQMGPEERAIGVASFEKYVQQHPKAREGCLALAELYLADKRLDEAQKQFETLHRNDPKEPVPLMALALIKIQQKELDDATKYLKQYIAAMQNLRDVDIGQAYVGIAQISVEQNNDAQASQWLDKVAPASPHYIPAQVMRAQILAKQGKVDDARKVLAGLQVNNPHDAVVIARTDASLLFSVKRDREATDRLAQAVEAFPDDPDVRYDYAIASEKIGQYTTMEQQLRMLMRAQPNDPQAYNALGYSLADRNQRLPEANALIEKASALVPKDAFVMDSVGWVKYRLGDNAAAEKFLTCAYNLQPNAEIGAHLGEVFWKSGQQEKARDAWRAAQKLEPGNDTLVNTLKRFEVQGL